MEFLKYKKPVTPSQRHLIQLNTSNLVKKPFLKQKLKGMKNQAGKNNTGKIVIRFRGGGHKKKYRKIDFSRNKNSVGIVCSIEYDPNRNTNVSSIYDVSEHNFFYILTPNNLNVGDIVKTGNNLEPKLGYSLPLSAIPVGSLIHNVSDKYNKPGKFSRSAGTFSRVIEKTLDNVKIKLNSGELKYFSPTCFATIGIVSKEFIFLTKLGKAGRSRWLNKRPTVRGVAMNPVDHPHGGGEGKTSGKGKNIWGKTVKKGKKKLKVTKIT